MNIDPMKLTAVCITLFIILIYVRVSLIDEYRLKAFSMCIKRAMEVFGNGEDNYSETYRLFYSYPDASQMFYLIHKWTFKGFYKDIEEKLNNI